MLGGAPSRQTAEMCVTVSVREFKQPVRLCQHYAIEGSGPNALAGALSADFVQVAAILDGYRFGVLHTTGIEVGLRVRRGLRQAYIVGGTAPRRVRRGKKIKIKLELRRIQTGVRFTRTIRFRIPPDTSPGERTVRLSGTDAEPGSNPNDDSDLSILFEDGPPEGPEPESFDELRSALAGARALRRHHGDGRRRRHRGLPRPGPADLGDARVTITVRR